MSGMRRVLGDMGGRLKVSGDRAPPDDGDNNNNNVKTMVYNICLYVYIFFFSWLC